MSELRAQVFYSVSFPCVASEQTISAEGTPALGSFRVCRLLAATSVRAYFLLTELVAVSGEQEVVWRLGMHGGVSVDFDEFPLDFVVRKNWRLRASVFNADMACHPLTLSFVGVSL